MDTGFLMVDPAMRVFHNRGGFVAGWQPMGKATVPLKIADFVLLSAMRADYRRADVIRSFRSMLREHLRQDCSRFHASRRIEELERAGILVSAGVSRLEARDISATVDIAQFRTDGHTAEADRDRRLRVSQNFLLRPVDSRFEAWSSVARMHFRLPLELVLILVSFSSGKTIRQIMAERGQGSDDFTALRAVRWMHDNGLLITCREPVLRPAVKVDCKTRHPSDVEPLSLNGRIPIYFVPHMPNHYPLALGMMYSHIANFRNGILLEKYLLVPILFLKSPTDILTGAYRQYGEGVWLFSNYMWSLGTNLKISAAAKRDNPANFMIHGGPSTPSYPAASCRFMREHDSIDVAVHGEGEFTIAELLDTIGRASGKFCDLSMVNGITFRHPAAGDIVRTGPRARIEDLDILPSPYLNGVFDAYGGSIDAAIIETNRGCPFGCTFCDWGSATMQKIRKFDLQRVRDEIEWIGKNSVRVIWVADANFGIYDRDIEISEWICETKKRYGYPKEVVVNYTKNATKRLAKIVELFSSNDICSQGIISIQTRDDSTLKVINRQNIKTDKYIDLAEIFRQQKLPLSTDLMIGLPGMTVDSFKKDLQYFFDMDITVKAYPTELLPNSPMADPEYLKRYEIEVDENNFLISTFSYSRKDLHEMNVIYYLFTVADSFSTLRYVLRYLGWDHGIRALDFLHRLQAVLQADPFRYPAISYMSKVFQKYMNVPGGWHQFYDEIADFSKAAYRVDRDSAFNAVLVFNEMVMPDDALSYPLEIRLDHDVCSYFLDHNLRSPVCAKPLLSYSPAQTTVDDRFLYSHINYNNEQYDSHQIFWELESPVSRQKSVPNFMQANFTRA